MFHSKSTTIGPMELGKGIRTKQTDSVQVNTANEFYQHKYQHNVKLGLLTYFHNNFI